MLVVDRLLRRIDLARDDLRLFELGERLGRALPGAPFAHLCCDAAVAVIRTRLVVAKARIGEPMFVADHAAPAPEHWLPDDGNDNPAVARLVNVPRGRVEGAVADAGAVDLR